MNNGFDARITKRESMHSPEKNREAEAGAGGPDRTKRRERCVSKV
jgi:hypothetical protein